uniref:Uncharacterized protein n=1 Tax=candidate division CPR3 bacterium TaxID=2268181 RepID=A0A7V3J9G9_UNCC3
MFVKTMKAKIVAVWRRKDGEVFIGDNDSSCSGVDIVGYSEENSVGLVEKKPNSEDGIDDEG